METRVKPARETSRQALPERPPITATMNDAFIVPAVSAILFIIYLFYLASEGSKTFEAVFATPVSNDNTATSHFFVLAQQDPFSLCSYAGFGLSLVPLLIGAMFLIFSMIRMFKEAKRVIGCGMDEK